MLFLFYFISFFALHCKVLYATTKKEQLFSPSVWLPEIQDPDGQ